MSKKKKKIKVSVELVNKPEVAIKLSRLYDILLVDRLSQQDKPQIEEVIPEVGERTLELEAIK